MRIKVIEVRSVYTFGRTQSSLETYQPEIEVMIEGEDVETPRSIILHPGDAIEVEGEGLGSTLGVYIRRPHGMWPLEEAPIR